jgi:hypothetical protein
MVEPIVPAIGPSDFLTRVYSTFSSEEPFMPTISSVNFPTNFSVPSSKQIIIGIVDTVTHGASIISDSFIIRPYYILVGPVTIVIVIIQTRYTRPASFTDNVTCLKYNSIRI